LRRNFNGVATVNTDITTSDMMEGNGVIENDGQKVQMEVTVQEASSSNNKMEDANQSTSSSNNETDQLASSTNNKTDDGHDKSITSFSSQSTSNSKTGEGNESKDTHPEGDHNHDANIKVSQDPSLSSNRDQVNHPASSTVHEAQSVLSETAENTELDPFSILPTNSLQPTTDKPIVIDVDSAYRETQDESSDSSSDSEDSVELVQEDQQKCIVIESDDQEDNRYN
jgi:hypothetical protein